MTPSQQESIARFEEALRDPLDLGEAALRLALAEEPELDLAAWRAELSRLGDELRERIGEDDDPERGLRILSGYLFGELGLLGNERDYYDPRNSYLHQVLQRGLGIPISLAVVALEVGRRGGLELFGVGFPAHFLVGAPSGRYLDCFHQGRLLSEDDCADLLRTLTGGALPFSAGLLAPVSERAILARMLRNLKGSHLRRGDLDLALLDVERLLLLDAGPEERRDRGLIQLARRAYPAAVADLEAYLESEPPDAPAIRPRLEEARRKLD